MIRRSRSWVAVILAGTFAVLPAVAPAADIDTAVRESYATNEGMLTQAATAAVAELFLGFNLPPGSSLRVEPASDHKANWFVEPYLLAFLSEAGYQAYLANPSEPPAEEGALASPGEKADSTVAEAVSPAPAAPVIPSVEPDFVLSYRVVLCELSYPEKYRTSPFGSRKVQRRASISLQAQVLRGAREDVIWVGRGNVERVNVVPAGKLGLLAGTAFPFNPPALESKGAGSYVEPVLVTGIVAGLIYLFYANQD